MSQIPHREEALFASALAQHPARRTAFLENACKDDPALHEWIAACWLRTLVWNLSSARPTSAPASTQAAAPREFLHEEKPGDLAQARLSGAPHVHRVDARGLHGEPSAESGSGLDVPHAARVNRVFGDCLGLRI